MVRAPRVNDAKAKRLRASVRARGGPCHVCGAEIDYTAHHHDPLAFECDHLWQVDLGGPADDPDNCAESHRACNRQRWNTPDHITVAAAARYGVTITLPADTVTPAAPSPTPCAAPGQPCPRCNGIHDPQPGITFVTRRNWWTSDTETPDPHRHLQATSTGLGPGGWHEL